MPYFQMYGQSEPSVERRHHARNVISCPHASLALFGHMDTCPKYLYIQHEFLARRFVCRHGKLLALYCPLDGGTIRIRVMLFSIGPHAILKILVGTEWHAKTPHAGAFKDAQII